MDGLLEYVAPFLVAVAVTVALVERRSPAEG